MIRINLLPVREERRKADLQQQVLLLGLLVAAAVGAIGWVHFSIRSDIDAAKTNVAQIEASIKKFEPQLKQVEAYKAKKAEVEQKLEVIHGLDRSRSGPVHMMDELATHTPDRVWLQRLEASGAHLKLEGKSLDNEIVAAFLTELNNSPYFGNVELKRTELESRGGFKLHNFEVTATIEDPHAPEDTAAGGGAAGN
jgi:type IV pilus assembly protein PilN